MTTTIRDLSEARQDDIEALYLAGMNTAKDILVAVAEQLEMFEREAAGRTPITRECHELQVAQQIWEAAYAAAGGVVRQ